MIKRTYGFLRTLRLTILSALLTTGLGVLPIFQAEMAMAMEPMVFAQVDQNVDGVVSETEFLLAFADATPEQFADADANGDTVLTQDEYEAVEGLAP